MLISEFVGILSGRRNERFWGAPFRVLIVNYFYARYLYRKDSISSLGTHPYTAVDASLGLPS